jgi:hypothetical protein
VEAHIALPNLKPIVAAKWDETQFDWSKVFVDGQMGATRALLWSLCGGISAACRLAAKHQAHMLAHSSLDQTIIRALLQRPITDNRQIALQKLAALNVPSMSGDINSLIALRQSDADFADWRSHLGEALTYVGELGEDEESLDEAREVVSAQLSDGLIRVEKATKKSPALQALKGGLTGFALTGISMAATAAMSGDPLKAAVVGGTTKLADAGITYVKALQARRKGRLILDVSMLFDPRTQSKPSLSPQPS